MKKYIFRLSILLTFLSVCISQIYGSNIDSLKVAYQNALEDTTQIDLLFKIGRAYGRTSRDSSIKYFSQANTLAKEELLKFSHRDLNNKSISRLLDLQAKSNRFLGVQYRNTGSFDMAKQNFLEALTCFEEINDSIGIQTCYNDMGLVFNKQGDYKNATEYFLISIAIAEEINYTTGLSNVYNNIGGIYWYMENFEQAIDYFKKALKIYENDNNKNGMSIAYANIGLVYMSMEDYDEAFDFTMKGLQIDEELGDRYGMSFGYSNLGVINENQGNYESAIDYYEKTLTINREFSDKEGLALTLSNLASSYIKMAEENKHDNSNQRKNNLNTALNYALESYKLTVEIESLHLQNTAAEHLQKVYTELGIYREALKYAEINISTYDTIFSEEKANAITEMTTRFEAEKKQLQIEKMEKQKQLDDATIEAQSAINQRQKIIILSTTLGLIIVLVFLVIIWNLLRHKRKANALLEDQNKRIKQQKEKIEEQNRNITDSIVYAQRIQRALLPPGDYLEQLLPHRFIFYKPRDIVSGDFYWVKKKGNVIITVAADCTGHGVPGAMMSMLGVSILNEVVNSLDTLDSAEILNGFRSRLIESLHQGGEDSNMFDGIDLALCLISMDEMKMQFAGANSPLYLIRNKKLRVIRGNKMPIGIHAKMTPFENREVAIEDQDMFYIFSDGFMDQFGGEFDKRYTQKRFQNMLLQIHSEPVSQQMALLEKNLEEWKGESVQIDDILVMGIRL